MDGHQVCQEKPFKNTFDSPDHQRHVQWMIMEAAENDTLSDSESFGEDSGNNSAASSSLSDLAEEASSSSPTDSSSQSTSPSSYGPLYELSELMNQLPIKRGLSKHYQGKSQSFTSLANVGSLEDLAKKVGPYSQRMKPCKTYAGLVGPKAVIAKKAPSRGMRSSYLSSLGSSRGNFVSSYRHPISLQKDC